MSTPKNPAKVPVQPQALSAGSADLRATPDARAESSSLNIAGLSVEGLNINGLSAADRDAAELEAQNRRRHNRRTVVWKATIMVGAHKLPCWVRNISPFGALLQIDLPLAQSSSLTIDLEKIGSVAGFVAWSNGTLHGIAFMEAPETVAQRFGTEADRLGFFRTAEQPVAAIKPLTPAADTNGDTH